MQVYCWICDEWLIFLYRKSFERPGWTWSIWTKWLQKCRVKMYCRCISTLSSKWLGSLRMYMAHLHPRHLSHLKSLLEGARHYKNAKHFTLHTVRLFKKQNYDFFFYPILLVLQTHTDLLWHTHCIQSCSHDYSCYLFCQQIKSCKQVHKLNDN